NFVGVLRDFMNVFNQEADAYGPDGSRLTAIVFRPGHVRYQPDVQQRDRQHADLIVDLMFELTRAANHVCAMVRSYVDARFRLHEGALVMNDIRRGEESFIRPDYAPRELGDLYPGLEEFRTVRMSRDFHSPS